MEFNELLTSIDRLAEREFGRFQKGKFYNHVPRDLFSALAALGLSGIAVNEDAGGCKVDANFTAEIMERLAYHDLGPAIFMSVHSMVCGLINNFGEAHHHSLLKSLALGEKLAAYALTEPCAGSDAAALRTTARKADGGYFLNGEKCYISSAGFADVYLVFARSAELSDGGAPDRDTAKNTISAFVVEAAPRPPGDNLAKPYSAKEGLTIHPPDSKMGCELSPIASLSFDNLFVPSSALLGQEGRGYQIALSGLAGGRVNIAACALGLARAAIEKTRAHLSDRVQFGQKLIEFQGLQFMLSDLWILFRAARALVKEAASELSADPQSAAARNLSSAAKCFSTDCAMKITTDAVQLLGGAGYLKDYRVEKLMRDAKMLQIVEGTNQIQRMIIARALQQDVPI